MKLRTLPPEVVRPLVLAEIDKTISAYAAGNGGFVRKYEMINIF